MKYKIIEECNLEDLEININKLITDGWEPLGGVSLSLSESDDYVYKSAAQAMIKREG